jgi:hypothetical protein
MRELLYNIHIKFLKQMKIFSLVGCVANRRVLDLMIGFIDITRNYRQLQRYRRFTHFTFLRYKHISALSLHW